MLDDDTMTRLEWIRERMLRQQRVFEPERGTEISAALEGEGWRDWLLAKLVEEKYWDLCENDQAVREAMAEVEATHAA